MCAAGGLSRVLGIFATIRAQVYSFFFTALLILFWQQVDELTVPGFWGGCLHSCCG